MIVVDSTALIVLVKTGRLAVLRDLYGQVAIGPQVKKEVIEQGRAVNAPGVRQIEAAIADRWICEVQLTADATRLAAKLLQGTRLGQGEAEAIALGRSRDLRVVLDDKEARAMAEAVGARYVGTAGALLEAFVRGFFTFDGLEEAVRDLGGVLWLSPNVVAEILRRAREVKR